jgi:hypothetical protein
LVVHRDLLLNALLRELKEREIRALDGAREIDSVSSNLLFPRSVKK